MVAIPEKDLPPEAREKLKKEHGSSQNVKTYYKENEKQKEFIQHHADRVASNRKQRDDARKNRPLKEKIHDTLGRGGRKVKEIAEPIIHNIQNSQGGSGGSGGGGGGIGIRPPRNYNNPLAHMKMDSFGFPNINPMAMGMNSPGIAGPPAWMMGQPEREPAPRRKPRRRKRRNDDYAEERPRRRPQTTYQDLGRIPPEVRRWMF